MQTVWNQIRTDNMSGLIWIQTVFTLIVFPKEFIEKVGFEKKSQEMTSETWIIAQ